MRAYITGSRPPSAEFLAGCFRAFTFMPSWLLTGDGPMRRDADASVQAGAATSGSYVVVPVLDVQASAGPGAVNEPAAEYQVGGMCLSTKWLAARRLSATKLRVIQVRGSSMEGVLWNGDRVLIDKTDTQVRSGFVYVLRQGDELLVKYCQQLPGGVLRVSSANPAFVPYDVDLAKATDVAIVGRVVASMHEWQA